MIIAFLGPVILQVTTSDGSTLYYKEQAVGVGDWDLMTTITQDGEIINMDGEESE